MATLPFKQVDVFTDVPFKGNPVAVVLDGSGLTTAQMQGIARWTNLSETTFVLPATQAGADYRVRIFTPGAELPFAGHPTLGTAHALLEAGLVQARDGLLTQECSIGLVRLTVARGADGAQRIAFDLPPPAITVRDAAGVDELEALLGTALRRDFPPRLVDVGPRWLVAQAPSAQAVLTCRPDLQRMKQHDLRTGATGVVIFGEYGAEAGNQHPQARIEVRTFAPAHAVDEDPVCGSGNGCVAAFIRHTGQVAHFGAEFIASQGAAVGRDGRLSIAISEQRIQVGGTSVTCVDGRLLV